MESPKALLGGTSEAPRSVLFASRWPYFARQIPRTGKIRCVNVGGEMAPNADVRPIRYEWVESLFREAQERGIEFYFHQCGSMFLCDGINIGKWNLHEQIACAEAIQKELEAKWLVTK